MASKLLESWTFCSLWSIGLPLDSRKVCRTSPEVFPILAVFDVVSHRWTYPTACRNFFFTSWLVSQLLFSGPVMCAIEDIHHPIHREGDIVWVQRPLSVALQRPEQNHERWMSAPYLSSCSARCGRRKLIIDHSDSWP